jgi:SPP1 gp7 family putative phage head morphogenesis protein
MSEGKGKIIGLPFGRVALYDANTREFRLTTRAAVDAVMLAKKDNAITIDRETARVRHLADGERYAFVDHPSELVGRKGRQFYRTMLLDDQIFAISEMKAQAILSPGWKTVPYSDKEIHKRPARFCDVMFHSAEGSWKQAMRHILSAHDYGVFWGEIVKTKVKDGEFAGMITLKKLAPKAPWNIEIGCDDFDNVEVIQVFFDDGAEPVTVSDLENFLLYSYNPEFGNPHGRSQLDPTFRWYTTKKYMLKFLVIASERHAGGFRHLKFPRDLDKGEKEAYQNMVKNMGADTGIATPDDVEFELKEAHGAGFMVYERTIDLCNRAIAGSMLMPNRIGIGASDFSSGSFALAQAQLNIYLMHLRNRADELADVIQAQIVERIIPHNFDIPREEYPQFKIKDFSTTDKIEIAKGWCKGLQMGGVHFDGLEDENFYRDLCGAPKLSTMPKIITPPTPHVPPKDVLPDEDDEKEEEEEDVKENTLPFRHEFFASAYAKMQPYLQRFDFAAKERALDSIEEQMKLDLIELMTEIRDKVIKTIRTKKIIEEERVDLIDKFQLPLVGKIRDIYMGGLFAAYVNGEVLAHDVVKKAFADGGKETVEMSYEEPDDIPLSLTTKNARDILKAAGIRVTPQSVKHLSNYAFAMAGVTRDEVLLDIKRTLRLGLNQGQTWTFNELHRIFEKNGVSFRTVKGTDITPWRIHNTVRTESTRAFAWGERAMYDHPWVKDQIVAYEWVSILDSVTSDYCVEMDGKVYRPGEVGPPPAHPFCRADEVPIFAWDVHELTGPGKVPRMEGFENAVH